MPRPCDHPTGPTSPECPVCRLYNTSDKHRRLWDNLPAELSCVHLGEEIGEEVKCKSCEGNVRIKLKFCAVHRKCSTHKQVENIQCCVSCPDKVYRDDSIIVRVDGGGIGDTITALTTVAGLKLDSKREVILQIPQGHRGWAELFTDPDKIVSDGEKVEGEVITPYPVTYHKEVANEQSLPRWKIHADECATTAHIPHPKPVSTSGYPDCVILAPLAQHHQRCWPIDKWLDLEKVILDNGQRVAILGGRSDTNRLKKFRSPRFLGMSPPEVASLIRGAKVLVGNDSGMTHLSGALGQHTVAVCGPSHGGNIFGVYGDVHIVQTDGPLADLEVVEVWDMVEDVLILSRYQVIPEVKKYTLLDQHRLIQLVDMCWSVGHLPGDIAEVGVFKGGSSLLMSKTLPAKRLHLFDTFEGLPESEGGHQEGDFTTDSNKVFPLFRGRLAQFHIGLFPHSATGVEDRIFCLVHLDGDLYSTTAAALDFFWPRMIPGGAIVCDDWEWEKTPGVTRAIKERFTDEEIYHSEPMQCILRKR